MKAVAYVVMEEDMFRLWSVFARETGNESAVRSVDWCGSIKSNGACRVDSDRI